MSNQTKAKRIFEGLKQHYKIYKTLEINFASGDREILQMGYIMSRLMLFTLMEIPEDNNHIQALDAVLCSEGSFEEFADIIRRQPKTMVNPEPILSLDN